MATPGKNDVQINISGEARQLENLIEKLMGMIRQLQEAAQSVSVGGVGGGMSGGGTMGGGLPGGYASGSSMVNRSAQPSAAPMGTAGRGTPAQPRSVMPGMGGASGMVGASTSYYTPAFTRADGGIQSMAGGRFGPMLPGHVMSQVNPGMAYDPSVQNATGLGRYFPSDLLQGMSSYFPSDYGMGSARRSASVIEQSMMNPRSVATWGVRGGGIPDFTDGWMTSQFPSEMYGGMPVGGAIAQMYQGDAARLSAIRARGTAVGMGARVIGAPSPLTGMPFASDIGHGPAAQSAAIMMAPERAAFGDALMGAASWSSVRGAIGERMAALAPYKPYAEGAMIVASMYGQQYYQGQIERMMTGRPDRMMEAGATGSLWGGILGTAIGAPMGGAGSYVGAFAGTTIGGMMGQYFAARDVADTRRAQTLMPLGNLLANNAGDFGISVTPHKLGGEWWRYSFGPGVGVGTEERVNVIRLPGFMGAKRLSGRASVQSDAIGKRYFMDPDSTSEDSYKDFYATSDQLASAYSSMALGIFLGGDDPERMIDAVTEVETGGRWVQQQKRNADGSPVTRRVRKKARDDYRSNDVPLYETEEVRGYRLVPRLKSPGENIPRTLSPLPEDRTPDEQTRSTLDMFRKMQSGWTAPLVQQPAEGVTHYDSSLYDMVPYSYRKRTPKKPGMNIFSSEVWDFTDEPVMESVWKPTYTEKTTRVQEYIYKAEQAARRQGVSIDQAAQSWMRVRGSKPDTGLNYADIYSKFGVMDTGLFSEIETPLGGRPSPTMPELRDMDAQMRWQSRRAALISAQPRGVGAGLEDVYKQQMSAISNLPLGTSSNLYAETNARRRAAMFQRFQETDTVEFDIPMTRLQGQLDRSQLLPYAPGMSMGMEMQGFNARNVHLRTLEKRLETLKSRGDLSESQELGMVSQIEGLRTRNAQTIATLSEGMENRLPAMSAGRPFWAGRFNSMQLAAMYMRGPARFAGAYGGGQLAMQNDFAQGIGLPGGTGSLSAPMNNAATGLLGAIRDSLNKIETYTGTMASQKTLPERRDPGGSRGRIN